MPDAHAYEPPPLPCPRCRAPLVVDVVGTCRLRIFQCATHGSFWFDPELNRLLQVPIKRSS